MSSTPSRPYAPSHWTLEVVAQDQRSELQEAAAGQGLGTQNFDQYIDLCAIEFDNDGNFVDPRQLDTATRVITDARQASGGAVVMLFVHGWKHTADWQDSNFLSFRKMVASMSLRERERHDQGGVRVARRVVGIYLGWEGRRKGGWLERLQQATQLDYPSRDSSARAVAAGSDLGAALRAISEASKDPGQPGADNSPLIFTGHSMGGLILEQAMLHWTYDDGRGLPGFGGAISNPLFRLTRNGVDFAGPDLVLLINPASVAADSEALGDGLRNSGWVKRLHLDGMRYQPPLIISVTSEDDKALRRYIPAGKLLTRGRWVKTAGFTPSMHTHELLNRGKTVCAAAQSPHDFYQRWHCLKLDPTSLREVNPTMLISLPDSETVRDSHTLYHLQAKPPAEASLMWILQVPDAIIDDHGDIFNPAAASLFLALLQISGAVVSIQVEWQSLLQ